MKQFLKYCPNIVVVMVTFLSITLFITAISGCSFIKPDSASDKNIEEQKKIVEQRDDNKEEMEKEEIEDLTYTEDGESEPEVEYFSDGYYYYMKAERHKQNGDIALAIDAMKQAIDADPESSYLKKNLILLYILNKDHAGAIKVAEDANQNSPDNEEILEILAKLKLQLNEIKEAKRIYERIININPQNHDAYILLGNIYINDRQSEEAFKLFSEMVRRFPESYGAHFFIGKMYAQKGNFVQAERELLKSVELRKDLVEPRFELIRLYRSLEEQSKKANISSRTQKKSSNKSNHNFTIHTDKVISLYEEILKIDSNNIKATIELPLYLYKKGEKSKASDMLSEFGEKYQNDDAMLVAMAKELINNDNKNDAIIVFNEILQDNSSDRSTIHYLAGITFDSLKEPKRAMEHFMQISPESEEYKKSLFHIAYIYSQTGDNDKAITFLESKLSQLPEDIELIGYLAAFYEENNQFDKALELIQKGLKIAPEDTELQFRAGVILDKSGDKERCISAMKRVIELDSEHANALNYLGYTYAELGIKLNEAEELIKRALVIKPDDGYITDSLGWVYYKKMEYDEAIEILEKAVILSSGDPVILEHLGDAYRENKMYSKALESYKNAISKSSDSRNRATIEKKINEMKTKISEVSE